MPRAKQFVQTDDPTSSLQRLSPRRQEIIRPILKNPREFVLLSVRSAAERLGTDPATMVRIIQKMGFENYRAFQNFLQDLSIANATSLEGMQSSVKGDSVHPDHLRAMLEQDFKNLNAIGNTLDAKKFALVAKRIHNAKRILLVGGDLAESLVHYLEYHLTVIGLPVYSATTNGLSAHLSRLWGKGDVVIAISFRRGLRQTVDALQRARENGAYCIGITGTYLTPIARFSNEFFVGSVDSESFLDSYVAPIAIANLLLVACANYDREATLLHLREAAKEQRDGFRWFGSTT
jgi:RpiR family carbohydrate utilization transcriptional regulator